MANFESVLAPIMVRLLFRTVLRALRALSLLVADMPIPFHDNELQERTNKKLPDIGIAYRSLRTFRYVKEHPL
jgi:hypothetical protein